MTLQRTFHLNYYFYSNRPYSFSSTNETIDKKIMDSITNSNITNEGEFFTYIVFHKAEISEEYN